MDSHIGPLLWRRHSGRQANVHSFVPDLADHMHVIAHVDHLFNRDSERRPSVPRSQAPGGIATNVS